jgi:hypothetical protein
MISQHPDANNTPTLPIPIDNRAVIDDVSTPMMELTSTFQYLQTDYNITQAICSLVATLPIPINIFHVKSHQDHTTPFPDLTPYAQINVLTDAHAEMIDTMPPPTIGLFPTWVPRTTATLFHDNNQVTSNLPKYIHTTAHTPAMRNYLIRRSHTATGREATWNDVVFDSIAWQHLGQAFQKHTVGQSTQLSKYMNDLLPTLCRLQTFDNRSNGYCFACNQLWEDTNHVL